MSGIGAEAGSRWVPVLGMDRVRIGSRRGHGWVREVLRQGQGGVGGREQFQDGDNRVREGPVQGQE